MNASRPTAAVLVAGLLSLLGSTDSARPADEKAKATPGPWGLLSDSRLGPKLETATDSLQEEDWKNAVPLLQDLLDGKPDGVARMAGRGGKPDRYVGARAEAERLLATMPAAGREVYQETYGPRAAELLRQARKHQGAELIAQMVQRSLYAEIVQRYLYTEAGPAALRGLAQQHYRTGRLQMAALCYAKLLDHLGLARWATDGLYEATVSFHHSGMQTQADLTLKQLLARSPKNVVHLGMRRFTPEELRKQIERAASPRVPNDWPVYGGNAARSARGSGGPPFLKPAWRHSMLYRDAQKISAASLRVLQAEKRLQQRKQPIIPAFSPITVTVNRGEKKVPLLIYKNYWGIVTRELKTGEIAWMSPSAWSLDNMLDPRAGSRKSQPLNQWLDLYIGENLQPQIVFENSTVGTLSSDGKFIYVVEDLAVPPPAAVLGFTEAGYSAEVQDVINRSRLHAFELSAGKLAWELGDPEAKDLFPDCYFLGPPLPLDGSLYVLIEKKREICLACFGVNANDKLGHPQFRVVFIQPLARTLGSIREDPTRRTQAVHLAYSDGILVCPTNAGLIFGVDVLSGGLVWAYPYDWQKDKAPAAPRQRARNDLPPGWQRDSNGQLVHVPLKFPWKISAPVIAGGKIVFTPPDASSIHCLNLRDGAPLWLRKKKDSDLYLGGVYDGKVLIVGEKNVEGINLADGATLWNLETGLPSGQGAASGNVYYLPLKESKASKQPEICAIDVRKGRIVSHLKPPNEDVPGNLLLFQDEMISLTPWEITAYPRPRANTEQ